MAIQQIDNAKAWLADPRNIEEQQALLEQARTRLLTDHVHLGGDIVRLEVILDAKVKTACTNGKASRFSPLFSASISREDRLFVYAHEVVHKSLNHPYRIGRVAKTQRELEIATIAFDAVVNRVLVAAGFTLPEGAVWLPQYDDLCEEEIFSLLSKAPDVGNSQPGEEGEEVTGWGAGQSEGHKAGDEEEEESNPGEDSEDSGDEDSEDSKDEGSEDEGSEDEGDGTPYEVPDASEWGEVEEATHDDGSPLTEEEIDEALKDQAVHNASTQRVAKLIGDKGSAYGEALEQANERAGFSWEDELADFVEANNDGDPQETWSRVDRRFVGEDEWLPGSETEGLGAVYILQDESGSVANVELQLAWEHIKKIHSEQEPAKIVLIRFDHNVNGEPEVFEPGDDLGELVRKGCGGTLIGPPLQWIRDHGEDEPSCIIVLTDLGIFDWHSSHIAVPNCPVIWADCSGAWHSGSKPPFGRKILVTQ